MRIVGGAFESKGSIEAELDRRVREGGLAQIIRFEGFRAQADELYRWADVVVVPSRLPETLGRSALEAMAWGRPPLVAGHGGVLEVVTDDKTGWIFTANDSKALAEKIVDIVSDPQQWRDFPVAAQARATAMFSPEVIARQLQCIVGDRLAGIEPSDAASRFLSIGLLMAVGGTAKMPRMPLDLGRNFLMSLGGLGLQSGFHFVLNLLLAATLSAYEYGLFAIVFIVGGLALTDGNAAVSARAVA